MAYQWEKAVVLRFGKFRGPERVRHLLHLADHRQGLQLRRPADSGHRFQSGDHADPGHGTRQRGCHRILDGMGRGEIAYSRSKNFNDAVALSAQTGLRDAIGKHELADMLSNRDRLGKEIQQVLDAKTNVWGITVQSVEIRDIIIPKALEDAMSRQAQARTGKAIPNHLVQSRDRDRTKFCRRFRALQRPIRRHFTFEP